MNLSCHFKNYRESSHKVIGERIQSVFGISTVSAVSMDELKVWKAVSMAGLRVDV